MNPAGLSEEERAAIGAALGKVNKRIVMNILKKIEDGGIPTERELEIVRTAGAPASTAPSPDPGQFILDVVNVPSDRKGQAEFYGAGEKTVKTWAKIGREAGDPAPFADPEGMVAWWERLREKGILKHRVPENLLAAATKWKAKLQPPAEAAPAAAVPAMLDLSEFDNVDLTFDVGAKMAELNYKVHAKMLRDALESNDPAKMRAAHSAYEKAFEIYISAEGRKTKIMAEQGLMVARADVERTIVQLHAPIPRRLRASLRAAYRMLPEPRPPQDVWNGMVEKMVAEASHDLIRTIEENEDRKTA